VRQDLKFYEWTLRDRHGPWCAWCLNYFDPALFESRREEWARPVPESIPTARRRERHHVVAKRNLNGRLIGVRAGDPPTLEVTLPEAWTVDVHRRCHLLESDDGLNAQRVADIAATHVEDLLRCGQALNRGSSEQAFEHLDREVLAAFESGQYAIALFLNDAVRKARISRGESRRAAETLRHQLSARAGIRDKAPLDLSVFDGGRAADDVQALLHIANHQSNRGDFSAARYSLARAEEMAPSGHDLALDFSLRRAQIRRSLGEAKRAVQIAKASGTPYRQTTALVIAGMIGLPERSSESRESLEAVLVSERPSWLYRAECWFGLGYLALNARRLREAYRYLIASQYVYGFLGLQALPHTGLRLPGTEGSARLPIDLLRSERLSGFSVVACTAQKEKAIIGGQVKRWLTQDLGLPARLALGPPDPLRA